MFTKKLPCSPDGVKEVPPGQIGFLSSSFKTPPPALVDVPNEPDSAGLKVSWPPPLRKVTPSSEWDPPLAWTLPDGVVTEEPPPTCPEDAEAFWYSFYSYLNNWKKKNNTNPVFTIIQ